MHRTPSSFYRWVEVYQSMSERQFALPRQYPIIYRVDKMQLFSCHPYYCHVIHMPEDLGVAKTDTIPNDIPLLKKDN